MEFFTEMSWFYYVLFGVIAIGIGWAIKETYLISLRLIGMGEFQRYMEEITYCSNMGLRETVEILETSRWIQMKENWTSAYDWPAIRVYYD